jgi:low affinity Fe/Cu permease
LRKSRNNQFEFRGGAAQDLLGREVAPHKGQYTMKSFGHLFTVFAKWTARMAGHPLAFGVATSAIVLWAITGPVFGFSDTWQLVVNTATTIVTFLMVFLIQNTQNRDTGAIQTKLDELIRAIDGAHNALLDLEELDESEIEHIRRDYRNLATEARKAIAEGRTDTDCREPRHVQEKKSSRKKKR